MAAIAKYVDALNNEELLDERSPEKANIKLWEQVSGEIIAEQEYTVGDQVGLKPGCQLQLELLHALDYDDRLFNDAYLFNVCTACGMTIPSKLWWEREEGSWHAEEALMRAFGMGVFGKRQGKYSYKCLVEWHKLGREVYNEETRGTRNGPVRKVFQEMQALGRGWRSHSSSRRSLQ